MPIFFFLVFAAIRQIVPKEDKDGLSYLNKAVYVSSDPTISVSFPYPEGNSFTDCAYYTSKGGEWIIGLAPKTDITEYLAEKFSTHPKLINTTVVYFDDNEAINDYTKSGDYEDNPKFCFAVVFDSYNSKNYNYDIRYNETKTVYNKDWRIGDFIDIFWMEKYDPTDDLLHEPMPEFQRQFFSSGFIQIQNWVDNYILREITGDENSFIASLFVPMHYDDWVDDTFLQKIKAHLPLVLVTIYLIPISRMISSIVKEKEYKIKEMMAIMGLSNSAYWLSWITVYGIIYFILALLSTAIIGIVIFPYTNLFYFFLLFFAFGISCICYAILISVFF